MKLLQDKVLFKTIIIGVLIFMFFEGVVYISNTFVENEVEADLTEKSYAIQNEIDKIFLNVATITDAYVSYLSDYPDATREETEDFLSHIMNHQFNFLRNIAYIEDTTIKFNYPYEENQSSIGVDLSLIDGQREVVLHVKESKEPYFIGPVELVQGGTAFILRVPVLVDNEYIGHVSAVIDADVLLANITTQANQLDVSLDLGYEDEDPFISIGDTHEGISRTNRIHIRYSNLLLSVFENEANSYDFIINFAVRIVGLFFTLVICYYIFKNNRLIIEVKHKVHHDSLTDDYNRLRFIEDFNAGKMINKLIAFTDINKFKVINDTLGHHFGDWGLTMVSKAFNESHDFNVYRNSGDEFILVSKDKMTVEEFQLKMEQMSLSFYNEELKREIEISLSMGIIDNVSNHLELEDMLIYLDYAMYDAKRNNETVTVVDDALRKVYKEQKKVEQLLIQDIKNDKLVIYYQPIINTEEKRVEAVEVLSRWIYEDQVISAGKFVDVVKKIRYIEIMDRNLFDRLQEEYSKLKSTCEVCSNIQFAVNLSAETLRLFEQDYATFDDFVSKNIIPIDQLTFEISEDINLGIISNETIDYIKSKGYHLVIDDFGSGVSKLTDVLSGKLFAIKTDKGMLPQDKSDAQQLQGFNTIIKAINAAGSNVVVEGVETKEQVEIVVNAGCNVMQGYFFGKPMALEDIVKYIRTFDYESYMK